MERTTQPILCCVGESVAGNHTQFVMERMLGQAELDWRVITVEVNEQDFAKAIDGMCSMGFSAVRLLPPFDMRAANEILIDDAWAKFIGEVSSLKLQSHEQLGWDSRGHSLLECAASKFQSSTFALCVVGSGPLARSIIAAVYSPRVESETEVDQPEIACCIWIDPPKDARQTLEDLGVDEGPTLIQLEELSAPANEKLAAVEALVGEPRLEELESRSSSTSDATRNGNQLFEPEITELLFVLDDSTQVEQLESVVAKMNAEETSILIASREDVVLPAIRCKSLEEITRAEQVVFADAYDFARWTGHSVDLATLRDAYEEYCEF